METPICDYVARYAAGAPLRLHMPGHKGMNLLGMEANDITEIPGADVLYQPEGIILQSEKNAASLFGSGRTVYSCEGSSLPIRAMLYLTTLYAAQKGEKCTVAAGRNAHKVFLTASALLDIRVDWLYPEAEMDLISCEISPARLEAYLHDHRPTAVYLTSPDYLGNLADIKTMAEICHREGVLLLVDNAHGAYLNFLPESVHPMALGADLCCDSAHKTLPVLTGGAYLHISKGAPALFAEAADRAMALFASTSPSYLILQSLDKANAYLANGYREKLLAVGERWHAVRKSLTRQGWHLTGKEPLKLTILPKSMGYTGTELEALLEQQNIFCEFADKDHLVLMVSPEFSQEDAQRVVDTFAAFPAKTPIFTMPPRIPRGISAVSPHEAIFRPCAQIPVSQSEGRIMASPTVSCPPAIPIVACGERITPAAVEAMRYYGIEEITVLTE